MTANQENSGFFAPDFPDWIEDDGVGIKLAPDTRTTSLMKKALLDLEKNRRLFQLFSQLHDDKQSDSAELEVPKKNTGLVFKNKKIK